MNVLEGYFRFDNLSIFVAGFAFFFFILTVFYSWGFMNKKKGLVDYYFYILLTFIASLGAIFANNLIVFMVFWGFLGLLLYLLISFGEKERTAATAKKAFIIIGGSDAVMLLGLALIWKITGTFKMDSINIAVKERAAFWAYICLAIGCFAKAGAMPFHTWIPDTAEDSPTPVTAYLPAALDKLLGIYFLARLSLEMFQLDLGLNTFLMFIGSFTIIAAVMMALVQHDLKRLLGYHAVSQVGYMVLGIGTGTPIGIAGGLFHMLNNTIYKSCLFLSGGAVEKRTGTTDLEKLGGLAKFMPLSFITFLIASLAISGVPPLNGFVSKWMVYQGVIEAGTFGGKLWVVWLVAAMLGSALTLASFMKLIHAVFLGQPSTKLKSAVYKPQEVSPAMWIPQATLAFLCILFGVFAYKLPLRLFIFPSLKEPVAFSGIWQAGLATILLIAGIIVGIFIYFAGTILKIRETDNFVGGEDLDKHPRMRVSGTEFYNTIQELGILRGIYELAKMKVFDIYDVGRVVTFGFTNFLRYLHNGVLSTYLAWCFLGMGIVLYLLLW